MKSELQIANEKAEFWRNRCKATEDGAANMIAHLSDSNKSLVKDIKSCFRALDRFTALVEVMIDNIV